MTSITPAPICLAVVHGDLWVKRKTQELVLNGQPREIWTKVGDGGLVMEKQCLLALDRNDGCSVLVTNEPLPAQVKHRGDIIPTSCHDDGIEEFLMFEDDLCAWCASVIR
jgi:hypothetical protein